jgi:dihydroflavonol-4-reductase
MRVLVTGGTGFIGGWTAKAVADAGHQVRLLVRDPSRLTSGAGALGVDVSDYSVGDITDRASVARALDGCDAVMHAAAVVTMDPTQADSMVATNLAGADNVLGQAAEMGLDPIVYVSSTSALFQRRLPEFHADLPVVGGADAYGRSKAKVEVFARGLQARGAPVAITYPGMVLGPPAGSQFGEAAEGVEGVVRLGMIPGRRAAWTVIDVRDLGLVHAALLQPGLGARRYMVGGQRLTVREIANQMGAATGRRLRVVPVPDGLLRVTGRFADRTRRFMPKAADQFTEAGMQYYTEFAPSDHGPSERDLGVTYRPTLETLTDTVNALKAAGRA